MNHLIETITGLIISIIQMGGYAGIFALMTAESALIPIPSEVTMLFAGFLVSTGTFNFFIVVIVGALANLFGSLLAYALGFWGEDAFIRTLIKKYGKYLLISEHEYDKSEIWFRKYGQSIVFFSRVLPVVRTFISLPAGVAKMDLKKFSALTFIGSLLWSTFLTYIGFMLGKNWHSVEGIYRKFEYVIIAGIILLIIYYIYHKVKKIRK